MRWLALFLICLSQSPTGSSCGAPALAQTDEQPVRVRGKRHSDPATEHRSAQATTRKDLDERQARSSAEALRFTAGVYVQQTGAAQASPYIRGLTGQHVLLLFDGLRLNNALFRQGPNQYFFTVDARTIDWMQVIRGSAGVELGAEALAGGIHVHPLDPRIDPGEEGLVLRPRVALRATTADEELGGRLQVDTQLGSELGVLVGVGYREVGLLEAAGPLPLLIDEQDLDVPLLELQVPTFKGDGRTQLGTGFDELTADARAVWRISPHDRITAATYLYRQFDAPRTDQCPPPEAKLEECLVYTEQFRTQAYLRAELQPGWRGLDQVKSVAGYLRQHERRENDQRSLGTLNGGRDDIDVFETRTRAQTADFELGESTALRLDYGLDATHEVVDSAAWTILTRIDVTVPQPRGQYVDGSTFQQGGVWLGPRLSLGEHWLLRAGGRLAFAQASAQAQASSDTRAVDASWLAFVANVGAEWSPRKDLKLLLNVEQGFRPPNLDDLTGRQPTGRGYQLENPDLEPERSLTMEVGAKWSRRRASLELWVFEMLLEDALERDRANCPESDRECRAARAAVQLRNLEDTSELRGAELVGRLKTGFGFDTRATVSYTWGEQTRLATGEREPRSRIPPLNGTVDLSWRHRPRHVFLGGSLRWARAQTRLSRADDFDVRVPAGGTPGYAVFDLRAGLRMKRDLVLALTLENVGDAPYRVHGSAVNGAGRGLILSFEIEPLAF